MTPFFSNLELDGDRLKHRPGSVLSSAALIAGTTVGAGVLALPAVTLPVGVWPSTVVMIGAWLYMVVSGLLIAEANLQVMAQLGRTDVGLLATVQATLGKGGAIASGAIYIFIHYMLLVAYIARGGDILAAVIETVSGYLHLLPVASLAGLQTVPLWWGHVVFALLLGGVLYSSSARQVGGINSALVGLVIVSFVALLGLTVTQVTLVNLQVQHWQGISAVVPVMFVAFVYQNVVPVIVRRLEGDGQKVRQAIWLGASVPLAMFALWNAVILGSVLNLSEGLEIGRAVGEVIDPLELLRLGMAHPALGVAVSVFSELAIATSFIGFVLGLLSVFEDIFSRQWRDRYGRLPLYALVLLPPLVLSVGDPDIFFKAIDFAGAFGNSILFGIIPAVMVWRCRDRSTNRFVPGGKGVLGLMIAIAVVIIIQNLWIRLGSSVST